MPAKLKSVHAVTLGFELVIDRNSPPCTADLGEPIHCDDHFAYSGVCQEALKRNHPGIILNSETLAWGYGPRKILDPSLATPLTTLRQCPKRPLPLKVIRRLKLVVLYRHDDLMVCFIVQVKQDHHTLEVQIWL